MTIGENVKLDSLYNMQKEIWNEKYSTIKYTIKRMNAVLVQTWYALRIQVGKENQGIFIKIKPFLL